MTLLDSIENKASRLSRCRSPYLNHTSMLPCLIFNPTAKGDRAQLLQRQIASWQDRIVFQPTRAPKDAIKLARDAHNAGHPTVIAAGGDGTVNEVLQGLAEASHGAPKCRLGVVPLGTANVFARELSLPFSTTRALDVALGKHERLIDLPVVTFPSSSNATSTRYFAQLAGAGLDARALSKVDWALKKRWGPLAYVWAGWQALRNSPATIEVTDLQERKLASGALVVIGNGRYYGWNFPILPDAKLDDGKLDVTVFSHASVGVVIKTMLQLTCKTFRPPISGVTFLQLSEFRLYSSGEHCELDGDLSEQLPGNFRVIPRVLRVAVP